MIGGQGALKRIRVVSLLVCLVLVLTALCSCTASNSQIESEADLVNKSIGVIKGSKSAAFAQVYTEAGCEIIEYNSRIDMIKAFDASEIDCAVVDKNHADALAKENEGFKVLDVTADEESYAFYMLDNKRVYTIMLNKALEELRENGVLDEIIKGYLSDPGYEYDFAQEVDDSNGSFTISIDPSSYPYVYAADEVHRMPRGIAIAIVDAVCEHLGCGYTFLPVTTGSLGSTLYMGTADFSIGSFVPASYEGLGMSVIESDPIMTYTHAIVAKK